MITNASLTAMEWKALLARDFTSFLHYSFIDANPSTELLMGWYIEVLAAKLEDCRKGKTKRLIINLPPRYLKSHCVSVAFVAWLLGHNPATKIICASYGQELSDKLARDCRSVMSSPWYKTIFSTRLSQQRLAVHDFMTEKNGYRLATSVGGPTTGRGGDFLIVDDPMKPDDALSQTSRNNTKEWFDNTLFSRLNSKKDGCIIVVMQRLHQDDLVGHLLEQGGWEVLSFPAIAEQDEYHIVDTAVGRFNFSRKAGDALHPEREPLEILAKTLKAMSEYNFASQYQQIPTPQGGAMVKRQWLKFYVPGERPAKFERIIQSWDTANKAGELNDYSVCTTWGEKDKHFYLLDVFRRKLEYPHLKRAVQEHAPFWNANKILIEDKASGTQLIQDLRNEGVAGITAYEPQACEKIMRFHSQTDAFESGKVLLPQHAHWLDDYIYEITTFPGCKHDDQVDSTTQAIAWLRTPIPGAGWIEYMKGECEKMNGKNLNTPVESHAKTGPGYQILPDGSMIKT